MEAVESGRRAGAVTLSREDKIKRGVVSLVFLVLLLDAGLSGALVFFSTMSGSNGGNSSNGASQQELRCNCTRELLPKGALMDGEGNQVTNCRPVWSSGALRRVFVCKFSSQPDSLSKLRRETLVASIRTGLGSGDEGNRLLSQLLQDGFGISSANNRIRRGGSLEEEQGSAPNPLINVLDAVLNGSSCFVSERQFRELVDQWEWIDIAFFQGRHLNLHNGGREKDEEAPTADGKEEQSTATAAAGARATEEES